MKKLGYIAVAAVTICSFALGAMNVSAANHADQTKPPKLQHGITVKVEDYFCANLTGCPERETLKTVVKGWESKTGNTVDFVGHPGNEVNKFLVAAPAGQGADIAGFPHDNVPTLLAGQTVSPIPAWAFPPSLQKMYLPNAIKAITLQGKIYSMPYAVETTGIFYNKALVPASKFKPLKGNKYFTWAQLISLAKSLTKNGVTGYMQKLNDLYFEYSIISGNGGYVFKYGKHGYDYKSIGLDSKGAIKGFQFIKDLTDKGKYKLEPSTTTYDVMDSNFYNGKLAMMLDGPWRILDLKNHNINFGFIPVPSFDGKHPSHPFSGFQTYVVNAFSKNKNEAYSLLAYMTQHMQVAEFKVTSRPPVLKSLLKASAIQSNPALKNLAAAAVAAVPMPPIPEMSQVWAPMADAFDNVVKGQTTPAAAAKAAVQKIKSDIVKAHGG